MQKIDFLGLPGLGKHCKMFMKLLKEDDSELHDHLVAMDIPAELYLTEWIVALGCYIIPIQYIVRTPAPQKTHQIS